MACHPVLLLYGISVFGAQPLYRWRNRSVGNSGRNVYPSCSSPSSQWSHDPSAQFSPCLGRQRPPCHHLTLELKHPCCSAFFHSTCTASMPMTICLHCRVLSDPPTPTGTGSASHDSPSSLGTRMECRFFCDSDACMHQSTVRVLVVTVYGTERQSLWALTQRPSSVVNISQKLRSRCATEEAPFLRRFLSLVE